IAGPTQVFDRRYQPEIDQPLVEQLRAFGRHVEADRETIRLLVELVHKRATIEITDGPQANRHVRGLPLDELEAGVSFCRLEPGSANAAMNFFDRRPPVSKRVVILG